MPDRFHSMPPKATDDGDSRLWMTVCKPSSPGPAGLLTAAAPNGLRWASHVRFWTFVKPRAALSECRRHPSEGVTSRFRAYVVRANFHRVSTETPSLGHIAPRLEEFSVPGNGYSAERENLPYSTASNRIPPSNLAAIAIFAAS